MSIQNTVLRDDVPIEKNMFPFVCNKYIDCIYYYNGAYNIPLTILLYCMGKHIIFDSAVPL